MLELGIKILILYSLCVNGEFYSYVLDKAKDNFEQWYDYKELLHPICLTVLGKHLQYTQTLNYTKKHIAEKLMTCDLHTLYTTRWSSWTKVPDGYKADSYNYIKYTRIEGCDIICEQYCSKLNKTCEETYVTEEEIYITSWCTCTDKYNIENYDFLLYKLKTRGYEIMYKLYYNVIKEIKEDNDYMNMIPCIDIDYEDCWKTSYPPFIGDELITFHYCKMQNKTCCKTSDGYECSSSSHGYTGLKGCLPKCE